MGKAPSNKTPALTKRTNIGFCGEKKYELTYIKFAYK